MQSDYPTKSARFLGTISLLVCCFSVPVSWGSSVAADQGIGAAGPPGRIVNGRPTAAHPAVGALIYGSNPHAGLMVCSGTMVGCRTFLTAAHCVCDYRGSSCQGSAAPYAGLYSVYLQNVGFRRVESIVVHPAYVFPHADLAVVKLARAVDGLRPVALASRSPLPGVLGTIVGFGRTGGNNEDYGLKRDGTTVIGSCEGFSEEDLVCWAFDGSLSNTCNGDSGGPLLTEQEQGLEIVGVTSGGDGIDCLPPETSYDVSVFAWRDWILFASPDAGSEACLSAAGVGPNDSVAQSFEGTLGSPHNQDLVEFTVEPGTGQLRLSLNGHDEYGNDFDLFVRGASPASDTDFDCRGDTASPHEYCEFDNPVPGSWYALIKRVKGRGAYQLTITALAAPSPVCGNGLVEFGEDCEDGLDHQCPGRCGSCSCPVNCGLGDLELRRTRIDAKSVLVKAKLVNYFGYYDGLDPRRGTVLRLDDGTTTLELAIDEGDPGWTRSKPFRGLYAWKGDLAGLRRVRLRDASRRKGEWKIRIKAKKVQGAASFGVDGASVTLEMGGACAGSS
ncbi:MAG: trypsin-like serine protease [Candidatus Binatia bacterium]